jgi:hypothetical protein
MNWYLSFGQSQTDTQKINPNWDRPVQLWLGHALPNEDFISTKSDMSLKDMLALASEIRVLLW